MVEPGQWTSFRVEPVLTDAKTLTTLLPTSWVADVGEVLQGGPEGVVFGSLDSEPAVGKPLTIFALGDSPILIEPIDQDPFLVRLSEDEAIAVEPTEIEALDFEDAEFVWEADDDPLQFDYVAFDPELAAGEGE